MSGDPGPPESGHMRLFDAAVPPLPDGSYRLTVASHVVQPDPVPGRAPLLDETLDRQRFFTVDGPRFTMDPGLVAGVFPPKGAHGPFSDTLPQIVLNRRTLPWERAIAPSLPHDPLGSGGALPWMALLLLAESEATLLVQQPLESVLPLTSLDPFPAGIRCDAVTLRRSLLTAVMPAVEEIQLLAHVRQVNVEDRELNVSRGDGFFSVVIGNRLPVPGVKQRAYLVSLEGRADLIPVTPPPEVDVVLETLVDVDEVARHLGGNAPGSSDVTAIGTMARGPVLGEVVTGPADRDLFQLVDPLVTLVCLYSWDFTCDGDASFEQLMQGLDVAMLGDPEGALPAVSDSGHTAITVHDRAGEMQPAWYRGPLVPYPLSRDDQGPYHSADQARRVTPDTGLEDISYSAAFELGRMLAVADGRLAQELMRWRRQGFAAAAFADVVTVANDLLPGLDPALAAALATGLAPVLAAGVVSRVAPHLGPIADAAGLDPVLRAPGLDPARLQAVWGLASDAEAVAVLRGTAGVAPLGAGVTGPADLTAAATDAAGLARLGAARDQLLQNARTSLEGAP